MKRDDTTGAEAARRFVSVDSGSDPAADAALATWLDATPANERAFERVELAVALGRRLAADPSSALYADAARAARESPRRLPLVRSVAWGGALAASLLVAIWLARDWSPAAEPQLVITRAAQRVAFDAPSNPIAVLPTGAVVDASAVAVLPFATLGDAMLAEGLERDIVVALRRVPGLYVIAENAVQPYAATELSAAELGELLGARGLVEAGVELVDGRVRVSAWLRESATGATLWQTQVDRPVDELRAVRDEIADNIATAMLDSSLRAPVSRPDATLSASKPFQQ